MMKRKNTETNHVIIRNIRSELDDTRLWQFHPHQYLAIFQTIWKLTKDAREAEWVTRKCVISPTGMIYAKNNVEVEIIEVPEEEM